MFFGLKIRNIDHFAAIITFRVLNSKRKKRGENI